jgi:peptide deformylase
LRGIIPMEKKLPFVQYNSPLGEKILYQQSKKVDNIKAKQTQDLIAEMKEKMMGHGIGLAANQIGHPLQIFMIHYTENKNSLYHTDRYKLSLPEVEFQVFINPKIKKVSSELISFWHGCLSAINYPLGKVATYKWIDYEAQDSQGKTISSRLDNLAAVIFQHEFRHLLGQLYLDQTDIFVERCEFNKLLKLGQINSYESCDNKVPHLLKDYIVGESIEEYQKRKLNL